MFDAVEAHRQNYVDNTSDNGDRVRLNTHIHDGGHARLPITKENVLETIAEQHVVSLFGRSDNIHDSLEQKGKLVEKLHKRTHMKQRSLRILLERNNSWDPRLKPFTETLIESCAICLRTGDPEPQCKVSFSKLHAEFND